LRQIEIWPPDRAHDLVIEVYRAMALRRPKPATTSIETA